MFKGCLIMIAAMFVGLGLNTPALACACCVNKGFYSLTNSRPSKYELDMIPKISFGRTAEFYMSEAGFDGIVGLTQLAEDQAADRSIDLAVVQSFGRRAWQVNVTTGFGRKGVFTLPMPATFINYKADHHDSTGPEVTLYKEMIFNGRVSSATGIFRSAMSAPYTLVFQGRGNGCDDASDYKHWRLELNGPRAKYALFGPTR